MTLHCSHSTVPTLQGSQPPLYIASRLGRVHIVRRLIQRGADVNVTTTVSFSVVITPHACTRGKVIGCICHHLSSAQKSPDLEI